jgi:hypothetical protein
LRILLLKGLSQYGGTRLFVDEAASAFRRGGYQVDVLDLGAGETLEADLVAASGQRHDLVFSLNILGDFRIATGLTLAELLGCPHVLWHTDYVLASWNRLQGTPSNTALLVVDPTQVAALDAIGGAERYRSRFFPHAAVGAPVPDEPNVEAFMAARPIPVLWSGGFMEPQRPWSGASAATQQIMDSAVGSGLIG